MLTARQNMLETIRGGNPERFVNQYEAFHIMFHPFSIHSGGPQKGEENIVNAWGVTNSYPNHVPGTFPVHTPDKIVVQDIENWRDYVKAPSLDFPEEEWEMFRAEYDAVDTAQAFKTAFVAPGLFEQTHHLCEITEALVNYIAYPDEMHELIEYLTEWELELAEGICTNLKPDAILHHDDWGTEISTFLRPEMFAEFFVEPYKKIYGYYHDHGVELVIHHSDSFAASLVPYMIEMGVDIWQGCMDSNNIPELIKQYGEKITFMGGIDNKYVDIETATEDDVHETVKRVCDNCGSKFFIPSITQGGPGSVRQGQYKLLTKVIDRYSEEVFGISESDITRLPIQIMFGA